MRELLKEEFPNHKLGDKWEYNISQFTAWDMMEFAQLVAKKSLENAYENSEVYLDPEDPWATCWMVDKESIVSEKNIPEI